MCDRDVVGTDKGSTCQNSWQLARASKCQFPFPGFLADSVEASFFSVLFFSHIWKQTPLPTELLSEPASPPPSCPLAAQCSLCTQLLILAKPLVKSLWGSAGSICKTRQRWKSRRILGNQAEWGEMHSRTADQWLWSLWLE